MKYYLMKNNGKVEITKEEWEGVVGEQPYSTYANKVYRNEIDISDVPNEYRENVMSIVENKIILLGKFEEQEVAPKELQEMLEGVL